MLRLQKMGGYIAICAMLIACGSRLDYPNLKKEGSEYQVNDNVRFYYPDKYELQEQSEEELQASQIYHEIKYFKYEDERLFYAVTSDETDNELTDRDELYIGELEQEGAKNIVASKPNLESGISVFEITGNYPADNIRFKHIVYFTNTHTYVYGYEATLEDYEENSKEITAFLKSIVIEESHPE